MKFLALLLIPFAAFGQLDPDRITVFKNNLSFVQRQGTVTSDSKGFWRQSPLPNARYGSFWLEGDFAYMASYQDTIMRETPISDLQSFWRANKGTKVSVFIGDDERTEVMGTIDTLFGDKLVLMEGTGVRILTPGLIQDVKMEGKGSYNYTQKAVEPVLNFRFAKTNTAYRLREYYLTKGINWAPSYRILLKDGNKAEVILRATLVNDAEPLDDVTAQFAVGVPNFLFSDKPEPILDWAQDYVQRETRSYGGYSNVAYGNVMTQSAGNFEWAADEALDLPGNISDADAGSVEDLFFYTLEHITLPKGGRGAYTLLETTTDYEDIFETDISQNGTDRSTCLQTDGKPIAVQHKIRMKNNTKFPWTTSAAMVLKDKGGERAPVSQDLLHYTPADAMVTIPITTAPEIRLTHTEEEVSRDERIKLKDGYYYDLITVKGNVEVQNYGKREAPLLLHRIVSGELLDCTRDWETRKVTHQLNTVNVLNKIDWEIQLKSGGKTSFSYQFKVYVRS